MQKSILTLSQWQARISDVYNMARLSHMPHSKLMEYRAEWITAELTRKHGKRNVYSAYVRGYVAGLEAAESARLYREFLEYCYCVDGVLYSTHKESVHRKTEEFYARNAGHELSSAAVHGHYWKGTDKPYFLG